MNNTAKRDPRVRLAWAFALLLIACFAPNALTEAVIIALVFLTEFIGGNSLKKYKIILPLLLLVTSQIFIMQIIFGRTGDPVGSWWLFTLYSESLPLAVFGSLRTAAVSLSALWFLTTTTPQEGTLMLHAWHVPYRYAMLITLAGRFFPLLKEEYKAITESQSVRGIPAETAGQKIKLLPLTFLPFLFRTVSRTAEIALAMELRGFGCSKERTFTETLKLKPFDWVLVILCLLLPVGYIIIFTVI